MIILNRVAMHTQHHKPPKEPCSATTQNKYTTCDTKARTFIQCETVSSPKRNRLSTGGKLLQMETQEKCRRWQRVWTRRRREGSLE
jgi:hypothetical protein